MASQQSKITSTSTTKTSRPVPPPRSTSATGVTTSNVVPTASTQVPVLTDAVQKCVDTAVKAIATKRKAKLVFMQGVVRRILQETYKDTQDPPSAGTSAGTPSSPLPIRPHFVTQPNYHNGQFYPPGHTPPFNPFS